MAAGSGVTYSPLGSDRWRVRWRERKPEGGWRSRETTFTGPELGTSGVEGLALRIRTALATAGTFDRDEDERKVAPPAPSGLLRLLQECIDARRKTGRYSEQTGKIYGGYLKAIGGTLHELTGLPEDQVLPVTLLSRATFVSILDRWATRSAVYRYDGTRWLLDAWCWGAAANQEARGAGRPEPYVCLPPPPPFGAGRDYLPPSPRYGRTVAPTLAHVDACVRAVSATRAALSTRALVVWMRYTGLRVAQVLAIDAADVDVVARTLTVRSGKSQQEKAEQRTIPLSRALFAEPLVAETLAVRHGPIMRHTFRAPGKKQPPTNTIHAAWEAATVAGLVPRAVWAPPNRKYARPDHAFRAAFQAHLTDALVATDVVDFLVGHEGDDVSVRERHYGRELLEKARAAVDDLPPIDWTGPVQTDNVVELHRAS